MKFIAAGLSDVGLQREHNEDSFCISPQHRLFVVADGMGGHRAGDVASKMAIHAVASFFDATESEDATWPYAIDPRLSMDENRLVAGVRLANQRIFDTSVQHAEMHGMGTTVVALFYSTTKERVFIAHVGDSRAYRIRNGEITQLTRDHSLLNDYLLVMPDMTQEQRDELPKNVITRALGMQDSVVVDLVPESPQPGDVYVLCSDGLSGMMSDDVIRDIVTAHDDPHEAARALIERANQNGGEDNVTVVILKVSE